jgi:hypothetical protein
MKNSPNKVVTGYGYFARNNVGFKRRNTAKYPHYSRGFRIVKINE